MAEQYVRDLETTASVELFGGEVAIETSCFTNNAYPVRIQAGPFTASIAYDKAIELGEAFIRAARHYRAAHVQWEQQQAAAGQVGR